MPETTALKKFHCPACGAEAVWNAGKQALVCAYCGTTSPAQIDAGSGEIIEHDLVLALREFGSGRRGWQAEKISVRCQSCQAISVFDPKRVAKRCDFCGASALVPYEQTQAPIHPESLLPFKVSEGAVREAMRGWYRSRWFAPNRLKSAALTDTVHGVYLPYWTFDAQGHADWQAESGYYYYTTETYRDSKGQTRTRQVRHVRWQPSSGSLDHFFDDELICASRGVDEGLLRQIEPFPTKELAGYDPQFIAGWVVEQYQIDLIAAAQKSRTRMDSELQHLSASQVPGDTQRNLRVSTRYANQTFKHILVPVWLLTFNYGAKKYQAVLNGATGEIAGRYPKSWVKITLFVLMLLAMALIGWLLFGR
ncbi:MAG: zinc ribbon domain-containing protein [Verrucomicrobiales bacterium]|nr:zinc ribbon domain-containing protein [Verrucomicrobiales bacterium]